LGFRVASGRQTSQQVFLALVHGDRSLASDRVPVNFPKRSQYKYAKKPYKARNWRSESPLASARADGAYDTEGVYESIQAQGAGRAARVIIPPVRDAQLSARPSAALKEWHRRSDYSRRSMVENTIYRYKRIIGREMRARTLAGQRAEMRIGCKILNTMAGLGMPDSYRAG